MRLSRRRSGRVLQVGQNCWRKAACSRLSFLIDGKSYFDALADSFTRAKRRIFILGWDFDSRILLRPDRAGEAQLPLGRYLNNLAARRPELEIYVLVWRNAIFYGRGAELMALMGESWQDHPRIHFKLDDHHPIGACHHQKIVLVDDKVAFVGGIDLTQRRWDDSHHFKDNPYRRTVEGEVHPSTHDIQAVADGAVAAAIAELAASRWQHLTGTALEPVEVETDPWPRHVAPDIRDHPVAVARTQPPYESQPAVQEVAALNVSMLEAAQHSIYIEAQYFALPDAADVLAAHLRKRRGPEIVIVVNGGKQGVIEQYAMTENRDRMFTLLHHADRHDRLRIFFPLSQAVPLCPIKVHSKLIIVDDRLVRVGSANLNRRSTGLDTECDLVVEAETAPAQDAIKTLRNRLLAEHIGAAEQEFADLAEAISMIGAIDRLNGRSPRLLLTAEQPNEEETSLMTGSGLLDPRRPITLKTLWRWLSS